MAGISSNSVFNRMLSCLWLYLPGGSQWPLTRGQVPGAEPTYSE